MPSASRTGVRSVLILTLLLGGLISDPRAQPSPVLPKSGETAPAPVPAGDASRTDTTLYVRDTTTSRLDTAAGAGERTDGAAKDSIRAKRAAAPEYRWESPVADAQECKTGAESDLDCWRTVPDLANQEIGFAGPRSWSLSLTHWRPLPQESPYFPFWRHSPYLSGGLIPPEKFSLRRIGGDLVALEEPWIPVAPLDTPVTRLDWMRGALSLNVFDFRLNRMLSDRVYLGLEYYSATAESQPYDYQFNVHQPYLGGWAFLGRIYSPIDRDSASIVLGGISHSIHALHIRPRVGFWIDSNRVVEAFVDRVRNSSALTLPYGPSGSLIPDGPDSTQALMPSSLESLVEGVIYGESHASWTGQVELSHGSLVVEEFRKYDAADSLNRDRIEAELYRVKGTLAAPALFARPVLTAEARSETWRGDPLLAMAGAPPTEAWTDGQDLDLEARRGWSFLELAGQAGIGRGSRMDDQVYWLPRYGASARISAPFGFGAEASLSSRREDPAWEILYRTNPARFRFANPELKPRTDRTWAGALSWGWSRLFLDAGVDRLDGEDAWLPRVLPGPGACQALADSLYAPLAGRVCDDNAGGVTGVLTDSLALALRNYGSETIDAWHLGLGLGLGHWNLRLENRFVLDRAVGDPDLKAVLQDLSVPERVFKGRLQWKRALLDDKLKLDFAWDWEWFSTRYAWVPDLAGKSRVLKLDEYLALDFAAAMKIKTFTLFFKMRNLNHDRYATEPGVHPPGVNFRFGVDWVLWN